MNERTNREWAKTRLEHQLRKYDIAVRQGLSPGRSDRDVGAQARHYAKAIEEMRMQELRAREVLMRHGVSPHWFARYYNYVRFLARAARLCRGVDFELQARAAVARWTGQGCPREWLEEILEQVFNVKLGLAAEPVLGVELDGEGGGEETRIQNADTRSQIEGVEELNVECGGAPHTGSRNGRPGCPVTGPPAVHG